MEATRFMLGLQQKVNEVPLLLPQRCEIVKESTGIQSHCTLQGIVRKDYARGGRPRLKSSSNIAVGLDPGCGVGLDPQDAVLG